MRVAHNKDGNRIYIDEVIGNNEQYYCPACGAELILKRGNIKTHHFAHKSLIDCDTFNHDMSEWHLNWQETFPKENREVVIEMDIPENVYRDNIYYLMGETLEEYNDFTLREERGELKTFHIKHRADVCVNNYVIEFQHSPISEREFYERNWFYNKAGYTVIWVFDFKDQIDSGNMWFHKLRDNDKVQYGWDRPKRFLYSIVPDKSKNVKLIFDTDYCKHGQKYLFYVDWASYANNRDSCNFKRFIIHNIPKQGGLNRLVQ